MARLNIEVVQQAIVDIVQANEYPSNQRIIERLGYGSKSTLTKLRAKYPSVFDSTDISTVGTEEGTDIHKPMQYESTGSSTEASTYSTDSSTEGTQGSTVFSNALVTRLEHALERSNNSQPAGQATRIKELETKNRHLNFDLREQKDFNKSYIQKAADALSKVESLQTKNEQLRREKIACENETAKQKEGVKVLLSKKDKLEYANQKLLQKNKIVAETIEQLHTDIKGLEEEKEAEQARVEAVKIASGKFELRNENEQYNNADFREAMLQERIEFLEKPCGIILGIIQRAKESTPTESEIKDFLKVLEVEIEGLYIASIPINESVIEGQYHKVQGNENSQEMPTTIEQNSSINEPDSEHENKFTLAEAHVRFLELCEELPGKKQKEYLKILDSEGYTNTEGNSVGAYNLNRWKKAGKTAA